MTTVEVYISCLFTIKTKPWNTAKSNTSVVWVSEEKLRSSAQNLQENSQNMAAGGFCVSDCSSPRRPSYCHYRPFAVSEYTLCFYLCAVNVDKLAAETTSQQLQANFITNILSKNINRLGLFRIASKPAPGSVAGYSTKHCQVAFAK